MKTPTAPTHGSEQWVPVPCECGAKGGQYLAHYSLVRCSCGKYFWALQPKRGGPLVAFPWPGDCRVARAQQERRAA
jgi:hypothetical protein